MDEIEEGMGDGVKENFVTDNFGKTKARQLTLIIFIVLIILIVLMITFS